MANTKQAKKRARQNTKRRLHNASRRSAMRTSLKRVIKTVLQGNKKEAKEELLIATSTVDRLAKTRLIHPNKAARHKSRLNAKVKALAAK